jgi:trimeric autotransporter adhesin
MRLKNFAALAVLLVAPLVGSAQTISTVVGGGPTGVQARVASIGGPTGVAEDAAGNLYFLDNDHSLLFKVDHTTSVLTIIAGNGTSGYSGDGGPATSAQLNQPTNLCLDAAGNIFIADSDNEIVREVAAVTAGGMIAGDIYTVAGIAGQNNFSGDGGPATAANLNTPDGVFVDASGNLFIADRFNYVVREVAGVTAGGKIKGDIYTVAGTTPSPGTPVITHPGYSGDGGAATAAKLDDPYDVFADAAGNLFIADSANNAIREVAAVTAGGKIAGDIYTVAGTGVAGSTGDGGLATLAKLNAPHALFVDANENIFICDINNQVIREVAGVNAGSMVAGDIYTIAGNIGLHGYAGDGLPATDPGVRLSFPAGVYEDAIGNILIADNNSDAVREVAAVTGTYFGQSITAGDINTVAGNAHFSFSGDGGPATNAVIGIPAGLSTDAAGNLFLADESFTSVVREVLALNGNIQTVAGEPDDADYNGDAQTATTALVNQPTGVFVDHSGNIFIADTQNHAVREIAAATANGMIAGEIYTIAGVPGTPGFANDTDLATTADLNAPEGVAVDQAGNIFIADTGNSAIREIPIATANGMIAGHLYTIAGILNTPGSSGQGGAANLAHLNHPTSVFVDLSNNIFIVDTGNDIVLEIPSTTVGLMTAGDIYTVAGTATTAGYSGDTGLATNAELNTPFGIYVDGAGNLFISDTTNNVVRKVTASTGIISTVAGNSTAGFGGDGGPAISAEMIQPLGLAGGPAKNLLISDSGNSRVRSVTNLLNTAHLSATPSPLAFGSQAENTTSAALVLTLTNTGTSSLTVNNFTVGGANAGDFAATSPAPTCTGAVLAAAATCTINVTFTPSTLTAETATISISDNANSPVIVNLTGTGALPTATPSPTSIAFGNQIISTTSPAQVVTITNSSAVTLTIASIAVTGGNAGDFAQTNTCSTPVPAAGTCTISVTFTPTVAGARASAVVVTDNAADSPQSIALTGTGVATAAVVSLNPTSLTFTSQNTGTTSAAKTVTLTNTGNATLNITSIAVGGTNPGDFAQTNTCGTSVAASGTCTISVTFSPTAAGARAASVLLADNANGSPQSIPLTGVGTVSAPTVSLSPTSLTFASQLTTTASGAKTVTLSNTGNSTLTFTGGNAGISITGANAADFSQTNTCGTSVAAGANCVISVTFKPATGTSTGVRAAAISIADNATGSPQTVALAGNGVSIALTATAASATVTKGQTATYNLQLAATGGVSTDSFNVTVTCSGAPTLSTCTAPSAPVVVTPAAASTFKVTATTTAAGFLAPQPQSHFRMQPPAALRTLPLGNLAMLLAILAMLVWMQNPANRARAVRVTLVLGLVLLPISAAIFASGCASAGSDHTPTSQGTPAGTYTLTVTASVGGTSQTTKLTLIVQ